MTHDRNRDNRRLTRSLWLMTAGAFAFGFALVPLYDVICDVTGFGNRDRLTEAADVVEAPVADRRVTVEFVSAAPTFGEWEFEPEARSLEVVPGKLYAAKFHARNLASSHVTAQAIPSIAPQQATQYFRKTECFCFRPQPFDAGERRELLVRFIVDPHLPEHIDRVTLAYSMYTAPDRIANAR